jgi:hypothetical protein
VTATMEEEAGVRGRVLAAEEEEEEAGMRT